MKINILVVEDEMPLQNAIKSKLEKNNFRVVTARASKQAINLLEEIKNIEVVWLDHYLLGREDGLDFIAKIKNNEKWKNIPVFVVSNTASLEKLKTYIQFGIKKYYTKADYRLDEIIKDIKKACQKK